MSNVDSDDNNSINMFIKTKNKSGGGSVSKKIKYIKERTEILNTLKKILNWEDTKELGKFYLYDLEHDQSTIDKIMALKNDVWNYFTSKNNSVFRNSDTAIKPYTSLIRLIFKEMDYDVFIVHRVIHRNSKSVSTNLYILVPPTIS